MQLTSTDIWSEFVGQLPTIGVAITTTAVSAFGFFKFLGQSWLDSKFARQLKDHQAALDRQLKHSQSDIDHAIHRAKKLYDREFDVMQEAWARANRCFEEGIHTAVDLTPMLDALSDGNYEAFLKGATLLTEEQRAELAAVDKPSRTDAYRFAVNTGRYFKFHEELDGFRTFLLTNSLFMRAEFEPMFDEIEKLSRVTLYAFRARIGGEKVGFQSVSDLGIKGRPIMQNIKLATHKRLWSSANLPEEERLSDIFQLGGFGRPSPTSGSAAGLAAS